jgi:predicted nuclease of restriction endonuclease-like (RecB) superfamily
MARRSSADSPSVQGKAPHRNDDQLYERVAQILEQTRGQVARAVNTAMVQAYWLIGREIVEVEQVGERRAGYGEEVLQRLSARLMRAFGKGFSVQNLRSMRQFFLAFPTGSMLPEIRQSPPGESGTVRQVPHVDSVGRRSLFPPALSWTHYVALIRVASPQARAFYELEAARGHWSVRQLERQISALLFDRLARHRNAEQVHALARDGQEISTPQDVFKDPFVLEFLGLEDRVNLLERDLEQAIIDRLETFLLEIGKGFCFVGRQARLTIEGDHFYVDLVFYNRLLRCFVLVDLKLGKLTHQDLGQMQMYVNYYDRSQLAPHEARTVGIILCSEKNDAMVKITLPENNDQILAASYRLHLPSEGELQAELTRERELAERMLVLRPRDSDRDTRSSLAEVEAPRRRATGRNSRSGNEEIGEDRPRSASNISRSER